MAVQPDHAKSLTSALCFQAKIKLNALIHQMTDVHV